MRRREFITLVSGARALSEWRPAPRCRLPTVACAPDDKSMLKYSESSSTVHSFIPSGRRVSIRGVAHAND